MIHLTAEIGSVHHQSDGSARSIKGGRPIEARARAWFVSDPVQGKSGEDRRQEIEDEKGGADADRGSLR